MTCRPWRAPSVARPEGLFGLLFWSLSVDLIVDLRQVLFGDLSENLLQIGPYHQSRTGSDLPAALLGSKEVLFPFLFPVLLLLLELLLLMLLSTGLQEGRAVHCG